MRARARSNRRMAGMMLPIAAMLGAIIASAGIARADDRPGSALPTAATTDDAVLPATTASAEAATREADAVARRHALVLLILKSSGHPFGFFK
jgi:hypothetical protein